MNEEEANGLEASVRDAVDLLIPVVEAIGALIIFVGARGAFALWALSETRVRHTPYNRVRLTLGRYLALGLEFQLGADILSTAVSPTFQEIGKLGAIATIRTALNYFLGRELREEAQRTGGGGEATEDGRGAAGA